MTRVFVGTRLWTSLYFFADTLSTLSPLWRPFSLKIPFHVREYSTQKRDPSPRRRLVAFSVCLEPQAINLVQIFITNQSSENFLPGVQSLWDALSFFRDRFVESSPENFILYLSSRDEMRARYRIALCFLNGVLLYFYRVQRCTRYEFNVCSRSVGSGCEIVFIDALTWVATACEGRKSDVYS